MAVRDPLRVVVTNWDEVLAAAASAGVPVGATTTTLQLQLPRHPKRPELGARLVPFGRELFIERRVGG